jgi:hypothetical protein
MTVVFQQLSWLCAAVPYTEEGLSYARVTFDRRPNRGQSSEFEVNTKIDILPGSEKSSCWSQFLPASIIASGFHIATRSKCMRGLGLPLEILCALSGVRIVSRFMDGYIIKMANSALVPIERVDGSIRWHYIQGVRPLSYRDAHRQCPMRLNITSAMENSGTLIGLF